MDTDVGAEKVPTPGKSSGSRGSYSWVAPGLEGAAKAGGGGIGNAGGKNLTYVRKTEDGTSGETVKK